MTEPAVLEAEGDAIASIAIEMKALTPESRVRVAEYVARAYGAQGGGAAPNSWNQGRAEESVAQVHALAKEHGSISPASIMDAFSIGRTAAAKRLLRAMAAGALTRVSKGLYVSVEGWSGGEAGALDD